MDAADSPARLNEEEVWGRLVELEAQHQGIQGEHELARRQLDRTTHNEIESLMAAWRSYCRVIAELDETTHALEQLRLLVPSPVSGASKAHAGTVLPVASSQSAASAPAPTAT
jgi:hypothetical protein